jgi:hypothetical protein
MQIFDQKDMLYDKKDYPELVEKDDDMDDIDDLDDYEPAYPTNEYDENLKEDGEDGEYELEQRQDYGEGEEGEGFAPFDNILGGRILELLKETDSDAEPDDVNTLLACITKAITFISKYSISKQIKINRINFFATKFS